MAVVIIGMVDSFPIHNNGTQEMKEKGDTENWSPFVRFYAQYTEGLLTLAWPCVLQFLEVRALINGKHIPEAGRSQLIKETYH